MRRNIYFIIRDNSASCCIKTPMIICRKHNHYVCLCLIPFEQKATVQNISDMKKNTETHMRHGRKVLAHLFSVQQHIVACITISRIMNEPYPWIIKCSNIWGSQQLQLFSKQVGHIRICLPLMKRNNTCAVLHSPAAVFACVDTETAGITLYLSQTHTRTQIYTYALTHYLRRDTIVWVEVWIWWYVTATDITELQSCININWVHRKNCDCKDKCCFIFIRW